MYMSVHVTGFNGILNVSSRVPISMYIDPIIRSAKSNNTLLDLKYVDKNRHNDNKETSEDARACKRQDRGQRSS